MANVDVSITGPSGETSFVTAGDQGVAFIGVTGTISAGAICVVVKVNGGTTEYVADTIDATALAVNATEAGTGTGSFFEQIRIPGKGSVALKANASFSGSVTATVFAEPF